MAPSQLPSLSPYHGFKSDIHSLSTSLSVSERSGGSRCPHHGNLPCRETGGHMKINLLVFKDKDTKDAITYQSWHCDITVYHHAGYQDHTLLPCYLLSARLPGRAGKEFRDRNYVG